MGVKVSDDGEGHLIAAIDYGKGPLARQGNAQTPLFTNEYKPDLAATGSDMTPVLAAVAVLLTAGGLAFALARRRKEGMHARR